MTAELEELERASASAAPGEIPPGLELRLPVSFVVAGERESFRNSYKLMRRLFELVQGGAPFSELKVGQKSYSDTTAATLAYYLQHFGFRGISRVSGGPALTRQGWECLWSMIGPEAKSCR